MSGLRERLRRVRGAPASAGRGPADGADQPSLTARLRRLGAARVSAPSAPATVDSGGAPPGCTCAAADRREPDDTALAAELGAECLAPGVLRLQVERPLARAHGRGTLRPDLDAVRLLLADTPPDRFADPAGWCALDTETSGLAGGTGTWVFVVGLARWRGVSLVITQYLLTRLDAEAAFLAQVAAALADVRLLLSYNGKTFDLPLLAARLRLARLPDPATDAAHLDLLHPVRRAFATRWPDCRLARVEERLLGRRRNGDLPGAEAPAAWLRWLRRGEGRGLAAVLAHNRADLLSVAALPALLALVHRAPADHGADLLRIARWRVATGDAAGARSVLAVARADALEPAACHLLARLHARAGDWPGALMLWERLAAAGDAGAMEALAKHFEHRAGDPRRALLHARGLPPGAARTRRCLRLLHKLSGRADAADGRH
jgi:uncharacterized protein YprB with RNaseH-like and TPR domain